MSSIVEKARNAAISVTLNQALKYLEKNPEANIPKVMDLVDKAAPEGWYEAQRSAFRNAIAEKNNWYQLMMKVWELDPGVRNAFFKNFIVNASLSGSALQEEIMEKEDINVPWAILLDPTSACNLHCTGCWAGRVWKSSESVLGGIRFYRDTGEGDGNLHVYLYGGRTSGKKERCDCSL